MVEDNLTSRSTRRREALQINSALAARGDVAKQFAYITVECLGLAFALAFAIFYFRLGWFVYPVWAVGLALVILVTQSHWRKSEKRGPAIAFVVAVYALSLVASWNACFDHVSHEVYLMTWEDGVPNPGGRGTRYHRYHLHHSQTFVTWIVT